MSEILAVDSNALFARSWYAAQTISDDPSEAIRLAVNTVLLLLDPSTNKVGSTFDSTIFCWDEHQNPAKNREAKPSIYHEVKSATMDVIAYILGSINHSSPDYEADDLVATVVKSHPKDMVTVVSSDKDLMQLQGDNCRYYSLHEKAVLTSEFIRRKFHGIKQTSQIALELAIVGDSVDCIKGIPRFGPVKCKKLFEAVRPEMTFLEALDAIEAQLTKAQALDFYTSLDRTLLRDDVPGMPEPAPLKLLTMAEVRKIGIPQITFYYQQVLDAYGN